MDVTRDSGLAFRHVNGATGKFYYPETFGSGAAFIDYDRDGWLDIFLVNGNDTAKAGGRPTIALYHRAQWEVHGCDKAGRPGRAVGDKGCRRLRQRRLGRPLCYRPRPKRALRNEFGKVTENETRESVSRQPSAVQTPTQPNTHTPTSFFRDVTLDPALATRGTGALAARGSTTTMMGAWTCSFAITCSTAGIASRSAVRGASGSIAAPSFTLTAAAYTALDGRRSRDVTREVGIHNTAGKSLGVAVWDLDGDRYPEILVANDLTPNYLFRNDGSGKFTEVALDSGNAYGGDGLVAQAWARCADIRNDGKCAVFISNFAREPNSLFEQAGPFIFADRSYESGIGESSLLTSDLASSSLILTTTAGRTLRHERPHPTGSRSV